MLLDRSDMNLVPVEAREQLAMARDVLERHLTLLAVHLYGSALDGGLKPYSDLDLLVTVNAPVGEDVRQALLLDLLNVSAPPDQRGNEREALRSLEVTVVVYHHIVPWRHPARREMQFGEWLRSDIVAGIFEPATVDPDLTVLFTKARKRSVPLVGPAAERVFDPVPERDFFTALADTLKLWNSPPDWEGDERNVVLTLARIWYSAATGKIVPKDVAAEWASERLPAELRSIVLEARQGYLGFGTDRLASIPDRLTPFVEFVKKEASELLNVKLKTEKVSVSGRCREIGAGG